MIISEDVLLGFASVAVTLIGFSGVVTAIDRDRDEALVRHEASQLFALVVPSIVTLVSAFVPIAAFLVTDNPDTVWRLANAVCFLGHLLGVSYFTKMLAGIKMGFSHKVGFFCTLSTMGIMLLSAVGVGDRYPLTFLIGLFLGIGISVHNFYLLLSPAIKGDDG